MAQIAMGSALAAVKQLDLFNLPPTQGIVQKVRYVDQFTTKSNPNSSPLDFIIPQAGQDFIDLRRSRLEIKCKVKNGNVDLTDKDIVSTTNLFLQSLFSQVDVFMNNTRVSPASTNYSYRAYIPVILSYSTAVNQTWLTEQLFIKDTGNLDDPNSSPGKGNPGLIARADYIKKSKTLHLTGPLYADTWDCDKWIVPGVTIKISLWRSKDEFSLISPQTTKDFHVEITEAKIVTCYCTLFEQAYLAHEGALSITPAKYPITKVEMKNFSMGSGAREKVFEDVFAGKVPMKLVVGFVLDSAYSGKFSQNPFNFQPFSTSFVGAYVNGVPTPGRAYEPIWNGKEKEGGEYIDCYNALFNFGNKTLRGGSSIDILRQDFPRGYALFVFDLDQMTSVDGDRLSLYKTGNLRLEIKFMSELKDSIQVIVYGQFPYILKITKTREIMLE